jgi:hypothetical protein
MKNLAGPLLTLALVLAVPLAPGCAAFQKHADAVETDVNSCVALDQGQSLSDIEKAAGPLLTKVLLCAGEAVITEDATELPACAEIAISGVEVALGPDGKRFAECVYMTIRNDPNALAKQKTLAKLAVRKLQAERS